MGVLVLNQQGMEVYQEGLRLRCEMPHSAEIEQAGESTESKPSPQYVSVIHLERVFVYGYVQLTTQALSLLLNEGIPVYFFSLKGNLKGILDTYPSRNAPVRLIQFKKALEVPFCVQIAKQFVLGKINNARRLLQRISYNRPDFSPEHILNEIKYILHRIPIARTLDEIRGLEGRATALYFQKFGQALGLKSFQRTRHPPQDPQNAFLSYGYAVLTGEVISNLTAFGLDPYIGFYHSLRYGRPGLALDLMEEFRHPVIDTTVLELWSHKIVQEKDIEMTHKGWRLNKNAKKKFFELYQIRMQTYRPAIRKQCQLLVNAILGKANYKPFFVG